MPRRSTFNFRGHSVTDDGVKTIVGFTTVDVVQDIPSTTAATAVDVAFAVAGAKVGDTIICTPLGTWTAGLTIGPCRCLVNGTVQVRVGADATGDPGSQTYRFMIFR